MSFILYLLARSAVFNLLIQISLYTPFGCFGEGLEAQFKGLHLCVLRQAGVKTLQVLLHDGIQLLLYGGYLPPFVGRGGVGLVFSLESCDEVIGLVDTEFAGFAQIG